MSRKERENLRYQRTATKMVQSGNCRLRNNSACLLPNILAAYHPVQNLLQHYQRLKRHGHLSKRCRCRRSRYLNNLIEQDHRFIKKRVVASQGFRSVDGALNTVAGYEAMNMIRKGQIRWLPKEDVMGQVRFIERIFGVAA